MPIRSPIIQKWWPTTQSLDIVQGDCKTVAEAVESHLCRFFQGDTGSLRSSWLKVSTLDEAFALVQMYTNIPTHFLVLPTNSSWTVLWNNSFLCDGYDSLCWNLTNQERLTTLHWSAHNDTTSFQTGASFTWREYKPDGIIERSVAANKEDRRWIFHSSGEPLPQEDVSVYSSKRIANRLNEQVMADMLSRLGANPWDEKFYDFRQKVFFAQLVGYSSKITTRKPAEVISG